MGQAGCSLKRPAGQPEARDQDALAPGAGGKGSSRSNSAGSRPPRLCRSRSAVVHQLRCAERPYAREKEQRPVKLVVFDLDETLTLTTFMTADGNYTEDQHEFTSKINFESPWVEGSRVEKLRRLFETLVDGPSGQRRALAVLTRNNNAAGVQAVVNLLSVAGLDAYFSAIWTMPWRPDLPNGAYREAGVWKTFEPPVRRIPDYKPHVLKAVACNPRAWFPQLAKAYSELDMLSDMGVESIVLVDDQRLNFQCDDNTKVLRYCKVARYDAQYHDFGFMSEMGGIGAHDDHDYAALWKFVEEPWLCKEELKTTCLEMRSARCDGHIPVRLVVFDFDETLTLATFMPHCQEFLTNVDWVPSGSPIDGWSEKELAKYNFESPWVKGRRAKKLSEMLGQLRKLGESGARALAVLTRSEEGAVAVLNLLKVAGLAQYFSAVWTFPAEGDGPNGVYQDHASSTWRTFEPPLGAVHEHKADILNHIIKNTADWLPQLAEETSREKMPAGLLELLPESVLVVDDERLTFRTDTGDGAPLVMRLCKVVHYDDMYRDCGMLHQMGGIGAHTAEDYETLLNFCDTPWEFPLECVMSRIGEEHCERLAERMAMRMPSMKRERADTEASMDATMVLTLRSMRRRGTTEYFSHPAELGDNDEPGDEDIASEPPPHAATQ